MDNTNNIQLNDFILQIIRQYDMTYVINNYNEIREEYYSLKY